jgi:hypothetical protein
MTTLSYQEYIPLGSGQYPAKITSVEHVTGEFGEQIQFSFEITGGPKSGNTLRAWATAALSPKSKLYSWASAFFPPEQLKANGLDPKVLEGRAVNLMVITKPDSAGNMRDKVEAITPA